MPFSATNGSTKEMTAARITPPHSVWYPPKHTGPTTRYRITAPPNYGAGITPSCLSWEKTSTTPQISAIRPSTNRQMKISL